MKELKTKFNQTPLELATEFIKGMQDMPSGGEDMDKVCDHMILHENQPPSQTLIDSVTSIGLSKYDATTIPFIVNCKPNLSYTFLAWICTQCSGIPDAIQTLVGLYSIYFYSTHPKGEKLTFKWMCETVGKSKLINFRSIYPWFNVSKTESGSDIYRQITPKQLYIYKEN